MATDRRFVPAAGGAEPAHLAAAQRPQHVATDVVLGLLVRHPDGAAARRVPGALHALTRDAVDHATMLVDVEQDGERAADAARGAGALPRGLGLALVEQAGQVLELVAPGLRQLGPPRHVEEPLRHVVQRVRPAFLVDGLRDRLEDRVPAGGRPATAAQQIAECRHQRTVRTDRRADLSGQEVGHAFRGEVLVALAVAAQRLEKGRLLARARAAPAVVQAAVALVFGQGVAVPGIVVVAQAAGHDELLHHDHAGLGVGLQAASGLDVDPFVRIGRAAGGDFGQRLACCLDARQCQRAAGERNSFHGNDRLRPQVGKSHDLVLVH